MEEYLRSYLKIDLRAIAHNIEEVKRKIKSSVKVMAVIKANGYGHGAVDIGNFLKDKVDYFGVATLEEAIELRENQIELPILILGYTSPKQYFELLKYNITQSIYTLEMAESLSKCAVKCRKMVKVHLALETGMNRIGFQVCENSVEEIESILALDNIVVEGLFTHFSCADGKDKSYTEMQKKKYDSFLQMLEAANIDVSIKHISNSAGIIDLQNYNLNMVRSGIITYGLYPSEEVNKESINLKPALEWKAHVINVFEVPEGSCISYGRTYVTKMKTKIATVSIGYADGYNRGLSSRGRVLIHGQYAPIIGRICMDQMMVDVTPIEGVKIEDEVTLVGQDGNNYISVEELANLSGSFNYEFVCGIGNRVERIYNTQ